MEQPYSIAADWLSKFHTWPMLVQILWVTVVPASIATTLLGMTWIVMRGLRDIAAVLRGRGEATLYGVPREWRSPALSHRGGRLHVPEGEGLLPPLPAPPAPPSFRGGPQDRARNP